MSKRYSPYDIEQKRYAAGVKKRRVARQRALQNKRSTEAAIAMYKAMPRRQRYTPNVRTGGYIGLEKKFYDTSLTSGTLGAPTDASGGEIDPSATICLNTVVQGDGESNRDGRNISMHSIHVNGYINIPVQTNQTATDVARLCYVALVLDSQTNGAQLNSEDVFLNPAANASLAANPFRNLQYTQRFKVLWSTTFEMPQAEMVYDGTNVEQAGYDVSFKINKDLKGLRVNYSGTTENISNIVDNSLHLIGFCNGTDLGPIVRYNARLRFTG